MIESLFQQMLLALPLVLGAYLSISLMKIPDLSLEAAYLFGAVLGAIVPLKGLMLCCLIAAFGGAIVGAISSILNQFFRFPFLLAAIITNGLFHGISLFTLGGPILSLQEKFASQDELKIFILIGTVLTGLIFVVLRSQCGCALAIYGNNPYFLKQHHISTKYVVMGGVILANACAGISGFMFAQSNGFVDLTMNFGMILLCLTSLILGKLVIKTFRPSLFVPLCGLCAYFILQQFLINIGFDLKYFNAFQALIVLTTLIILKRDSFLQTATDHLGV